MNLIIYLISLNKISESIALQLNVRWAEKYIYYIVIAVTIVFIIFILNALRHFFLSRLMSLRSLMRRFNEHRRKKSNKKAILRNIKRLIAAKEYKAAAETCISIDEFEEAAKMYVKAGKPASAAEIYEHIGKLNEAVSLYKEANNITKSAELYEMTGQLENAAQFYKTGGFFRKSAELYEKLNNYLKAAELYEICFIEEGPRTSKTRESHSYAYLSGKMYEKADHFDKAIAVYLKDNCYKEAALVYEKKGQYLEAGEYYEKAGDVEKAAEAFERGGNLNKSNELLSKVYYGKGLLREAAVFAEKAGDSAQAAEIYTEVQEFSKAGEQYAKAGYFNEAGEKFIQVDDFQRAAEAFEKGGKYVWAAQAFEKVGERTVNVAELYEKGGDYLKAGRLYNELDLVDSALNTLQKIDQESENYLEASILIGEIFLNRGMIKIAIEKFQKIIDDIPLSKSSLEPYYYMAICHEKSGEREKAKDFYDRILAEDYQFRDVLQRLNELTLSSTGTSIPSKRIDHTTFQDEKIALSKGQSVKRFQLMEEVGRGNMSIVYKAKDTLLNRIVAYKLLPSLLTASPVYFKRFMKEAQISANLNHRNIIMIFDAGQAGDNNFITMEYIEGKTLHEHLKQLKKFKISDAVIIAKQICRGLVYAHKNNVVHQDIKPSNIMLSREGVIKIMDFGIAKLLEDMTKEATSISGTPLYMSPEQIEGKEIDYQTDLYSFGATLFHLITGNPPFTEGNLYYHHLHTAPPSPKDFEGSTPDSLCAIILKCLEKDKSLRYKKAEEILMDLDKISV